MKTLVFGPGLLEPTLNGEKRFSVRKYREGAHDFVAGETVLGEFKDGLNVLLQITHDTKIGTFEELKSPPDADNDNEYWFDESYFNELGEYYPGLKWDDTGAIVFFQILHVDGVPIIAKNDA